MTERFHFMSAYQMARWQTGFIKCMLISLKDDEKVPFPVCLSVDKMAVRFHFLHYYQLRRWCSGQDPLRVSLLFNKLTDRPFSCPLTSRQDGGQIPFPAYLPVDKMPEGFRFLSAHRKWYDGRQAPNSCLLTSRHDERQISFSCLLTNWKDVGEVPFSICLYSWHDSGKVVYPVCLPVDIMPHRSYFSCLFTSWQDGGKVPFPVCLPVDKMADWSHFCVDCLQYWETRVSVSHVQFETPENKFYLSFRKGILDSIWLLKRQRHGSYCKTVSIQKSRARTTGIFSYFHVYAWLNLKLFSLHANEDYIKFVTES